MLGLGSFFDSLSSLYRTDVDTSFNVKTLYSGEFFALRMKRKCELYGTKIECIIGNFNDYYDIDKDVVNLTSKTMDECSAIAAACACHEIGHAIAYKRGFTDKGYKGEAEATRIALEFLKGEMSDNEFAAAERFLNNALKTYKK